MTHNEIIAVVQAHKDGKSIQCKCRDSVVNDTWHDSPTPVWNFGVFDYRVKPEPREFWLCTSARCGCGSLINGTDGWHAYDCNQGAPKSNQIHVREVID